MPPPTLHQTLSIAHTAECKLHLAASRPDRDLRFLLGHALTLDSISLRLVEIERETAATRQPRHASSIKFQAAPRSKAAVRRRSPPPPPSRFSEMRAGSEEDDEDALEDDDEDEEGDANQDFSSDDDQDELALTRFPSGAARPPEEVPGLVPSDDSSEDDDEDGPKSPEMPDEEVLRRITKGESDQELMDVYAKVKKCPCHGHHVDGPDLGRMWEVPSKEGEGREGVRIVVAEVEG